MSSVRIREHEWTRYELHTMLCLMAKGVHLEERVKRTAAPGTARVNAYDNFATQLNFALHRKDYDSDIPKREIINMLDRLLVENKHVVGKGGLLERVRNGRITRTVSDAFRSCRKFDFDGSMSEWKNGRREEVMVPYLIKMGKMKPVARMDVEKDAFPVNESALTKKSGADEMSLRTIKKDSRSTIRKTPTRRLLASEVAAAAEAAIAEADAIMAGGTFNTSSQETVAKSIPNALGRKHLDWDYSIRQQLRRSPTNARAMNGNGLSANRPPPPPPAMHITENARSGRGFSTDKITMADSSAHAYTSFPTDLFGSEGRGSRD